MTSTMAHMVNVVGVLLFINFFNVSRAQSIKVGEYNNYYHKKTRHNCYKYFFFTKFDANSL
jgi:hypothetical protein